MNAFAYLTVEQVLFIHMRLIAETGGRAGLRDLGLLSSAVARPQATFGGEDLYVDIFAKTAALLESLVRNHPFGTATSAPASRRSASSCAATASV